MLFFKVVFLICLARVWSHFPGLPEDFEESVKFKTTCVRGHGCSKEEILHSRRDVELGRLPEDLLPYHHNIEIRTDIYQAFPPFPFDGWVEIWLDCHSATDLIYLNSRSLSIDPDSIQLEVAEESPIQPDPPEWTSFELDDDLQFFILHLDGALVEGAKYRVRVGFSGTLNLAALDIGYFWDSYQQDGQTTYLAATQFQAFHTRSAFPCFDEPAFKSTYNVTLLRMSSMKSLSNMPIIAQEDREDGWIADYYDTTPKMSAYLLCFIICDFNYIETVTPMGHVVRVWARDEVLHAAEFALEAAVLIQEWFEDYTGIEYPLPKMDHIALPSKGGAMENWGLITYGEYVSLWDPAWSTSYHKGYVAMFIAHELAHMWFGNYVTCNWWNNTWLNEGFASFFEHRPLSDTYGWDGSDIHVAHAIPYIMFLDADNTSVPVRIEVESPWQAGLSFSSFTYSKGGAIVRMILQTLGEDSFRRALNRYLTDHAYDSVSTDDLWNALSAQAAEDGITDTDGSPLDFKEKFDPWVDQSGFPLLNIQQTEDGAAEAYQSRFLFPPGQEVNLPSPWDYRWYVPITYTTELAPELNTDTRIWLDLDNKTLTEDIGSTSEWLMANVMHLGYYIIDYDEDNRAALVRQLLDDPQVIPSESRAGLIHNTFSLARAGYHTDVVGFEFTQHLYMDTSYSTWVSTEKFTYYPSRMLSRYPGTYDKLQDYMRSLVDPVYEVIGWVPDEENEPIERMALRTHILWLACIYENEDCIQESSSQFDEWKEDIDNNPIATDVHLPVYCNAIRAGTVEDFDHALLAYQRLVGSTHPFAYSEQNMLLLSMACTDDAIVLQRYLDLTFDPEEIDSADTVRALDFIATSDFGGREFMWNHILTSWRDPNIFPDGISQYEMLLTTVGGFASEEDIDELNSFFETYPADGPVEQGWYNQAMDAVLVNNDWAQLNQEELDDWLGQHTPRLDTNRKSYSTRSMRSRPGHHMIQWLEPEHHFTFTTKK